MSSKLEKEIKNLVDEQVITDDIAKNILFYYANKKNTASYKLFNVFGIFGALLVGSGIILILAHNWDHFPKYCRIFFAFFPMILGQLMVFYSIRKKKNNTWREASGTFLFFAVGACIALISQIYHILGDLSSFLLIWILLVLPIVYVLQSKAVGLLCILLITYYAVNVSYNIYGDNNSPWYSLVMIAAIIPFYWIQLKKGLVTITTTMFNWILPVSGAIILGGVIEKNAEMTFIMYSAFYGVCYGISKQAIFNDTRVFSNGFLVIGSLGSISILMLSTSTDFWEELMYIKKLDTQEFYISFILATATIVLAIYNYIRNKNQGIDLLQISLVIFWAIVLLNPKLDSTFTLIFMNVLVLVLGILTIKKGAEKVNFAILNYGLLIISILIICRFFDTQMSFVIRGLSFIGVGAGFFMVNYQMFKKVNKQNNKSKTE